MTRTMEIKSKDQRRIEQLEAQNLANMLAMVEMYEDKIKLEEHNVATMLAITELYEMIGG